LLVASLVESQLVDRIAMADLKGSAINFGVIEAGSHLAGCLGV
jgi:hypothetical protein